MNSDEAIYEGDDEQWMTEQQGDVDEWGPVDTALAVATLLLAGFCMIYLAAHVIRAAL